MTKEEILVKLIKNIPYPNQISDLDLSSESDAIRFTWRSDRFRISLTGSVEQVEKPFLAGSNMAILMETLIFHHHKE